MKRIYKAGEVYLFKTSPYYKFSEPDTQRYVCLKILSPETTKNQPKDTLVTYIVLNGIYEASPSLDEVSQTGPLIRKRFAYGQMTAFQRMSKNPPKNYATNSARADWEPDLLEFSLLGHLPLSEQENTLSEQNSSYSAWRFASLDAEGEWRWEHDQERLISEDGVQKKENDRRKQAEKERFENRLSKLTWEILATENFCERWSESPPFPSSSFRDELIHLIRTAITDLQKLGQKYPRAKVRKILKTLVDDITSLDRKFDHPIETEEREDIYGVFDDLTFLSKQRVLMDEIPDWHYLEW